MSTQASYQPPFTLTPVSLRLVAEIAEAIGRLSAQVASPAALRLRRNRIRTIPGTLSNARISGGLDCNDAPRETQQPPAEISAD